jgi:opine dehydrogenase
MEIAVLGGGHGCYAAAAELSEQGHRVRWWRREASSHAVVAAEGGVTVTDFRGTRKVGIQLLTADLARAVRGAILIVVPLPAVAHASLAPDLARVLEAQQVVFLPPGTFGSFLFASELQRLHPELDVSFAETGTLPYLARKHGPAQVVVSAYATRLPTGILPERNAAHALSVLKRAYPAVEACGDALSGALMNAGPIIHPPLILMNAGPLEGFPAWDIHNEGTQPAVRRTIDALDAERVQLREKLGCGPPHFPLRDHYDRDGDEWMYGRAAHKRLTDSGDWREKIDLGSHRYMIEDVALGLSFLTSVARWAGVRMELAEGFLAIGSAILGRNLYATGRTLENLQIAHLSPEVLQEVLHDGVHVLGRQHG